MDLSNFENHSKTSDFKKLKHLLYKYYPKLVKTHKNESNLSSYIVDINQFLVVLYDCVPNLKQFLSIGNLSKKN